jgi:hypothetical protein
MAITPVVYCNTTVVITYAFQLFSLSISYSIVNLDGLRLIGTAKNIMNANNALAIVKGTSS